jgi:hypothetical protein
MLFDYFIDYHCLVGLFVWFFDLILIYLIIVCFKISKKITQKFGTTKKLLYI